MPRIRSRKTSSGALPYPASKPKPTTKKLTTTKPTTKKPNGKATAAAAAAVTAARKHANFINAMLESEFLELESPLPSTALGDLSNPILRVFKATNFVNVKDYSVMEPSVRLASHLLKHPSLRPMLRTILKHGNMIPLREKESSGNFLYRYPDDSAAAVTGDDVALIDTALDDLAEFVTFEAMGKHGPADARTAIIVKRKAKRVHTTETLPGHHSRVEYSLALLRRLEEASKPPSSKQDKPFLLVWRFSLAVQLAHEVCHALINAKDGRLKAFHAEPFFHGALTAEVGFAMEETLFGGSPALLWQEEQPDDEQATRVHHISKSKLSDLVGVYVLWSWPCTSIIRDYQAQNCALHMRKADMAALKPKDVAWRISLEDLSRFFDTAFWAQENPDTIFDRSVGFAFISNDKGERSPAEVSKQELRSYATRAFKISKRKAIVMK